jgi:EF-P beta-lysylation protein EpmB
MNKPNWRDHCKNHLNSEDISEIKDYDQASEDLFRLQVPNFYHELIDYTNPKDPLLLQVLPSKHESIKKPGYIKDAVGDIASRKAKGIIHKYHGRVLLIATGSCAINCRYCFRRNFPYSQNNASSHNWHEAINYITKNKDIHEVILSGGDPLMLSTKILNNLSTQLEKIKSVKTLRIHTRTPLVSPLRVSDNLLMWLNNLSLKKVMVLHCNHPQELTKTHQSVLSSIKNTNTLLLNQSVLLKGVNDNAETLSELSHKLFDYGVLPYYLNQLDKVSGAHHFQVSDERAKSIHRKLLQQLPGYLVPKLVEEIQGKKNKSPMF